MTDAIQKNENVSSNKLPENFTDELLLEPLTYTSQVSGKNVSPRLIRAFNYWLNISEEKLAVIEEIIQMFHNANLLIDDIEDDPVLRRGTPVAHTVLGLSRTSTNSASSVLMTAVAKIMALDHPDALRVITEQVLEMHKGQGIELYWRTTFTCPTEREYYLMAIKKTGALFKLAIRLMQLFSTNKNDFSDVADTAGIFFQIADEYKHLNSKEYLKNKGYCEDLTAVTFSFPVIHAIRKYPSDEQIISIVRQQTESVEVKKYCVTLLEKFGSFEYTRETLKTLRSDVAEKIQKFGGNDQLMEFLDSFCTNIF